MRTSPFIQEVVSTSQEKSNNTPDTGQQSQKAPRVSPSCSPPFLRGPKSEEYLSPLGDVTSWPIKEQNSKLEAGI